MLVIKVKSEPPRVWHNGAVAGQADDAVCSRCGIFPSIY